jgi:hypothetical protein
MVRGKKKKKSESNWAIAAVVAIVLFGTWFVWRSRAPEHVVVRSDDHVVTVSGNTRSSDVLEVTHVEDVTSLGDGFVSDLYEVAFVEEGYLVEGEVLMVFANAAEQELDLTELAIYHYDPSVMDWVALPTVFDLVRRNISAELTVSDSIVLVAGERVDIE